MNKKTIVIHHSADYDGIFCREIARKFLPDAELVGWDYGQPTPLKGQLDGTETLYIMDISIPDLMTHPNLIWIDHHKSAIEKFPDNIRGYRIDGVAACRLAWQWFRRDYLCGAIAREVDLPSKESFTNRTVEEPYAVTLAGEYDIWDHAKSNEDDIAFQFGLDSVGNIEWDELLQSSEHTADAYRIVNAGKHARACYKKRDADILRERSFMVDFSGLKFIALNTPRCNSNTFASKDVPETGHDALMGFFWTGKEWSVSMYHAAHRKDLDLSLIASANGGGGHRGACGFRAAKLPFIQT